LSRNIDVCRDPTAGALPAAVNAFLTIASAFGSTAAIVIAVTALGAAVAGCSSDSAAMQKPEGSGHMRYYGGPKSPMWRGPAANQRFNSPIHIRYVMTRGAVPLVGACRIGDAIGCQNRPRGL
jgi:hypothetical protein